MSFFICNALGFFIQLYPCALMIFFPFPQETYRFRRKAIFTGMTLISVVLALIFLVVLYCTMNTMGTYGIWANVYMFGAVLLILASYIWLIRDAVIKKLLVFSLVLFYATTQFWLVNLYMCFIEPPRAEITGPYPAGVLLLYVVIAAVLLPLMLATVICPVRDFIREIEPKQMRREFCISLLSTMVYFVLMTCINSIWGFYINRGSWLLYSVLFLFLMLNQGLIFWLIFRESVRRKRDSERQKTLEIQQLQYEKIAGEIENTRRMRHDLRHHYNSLTDMLEKKQFDEMREYLSKTFDSTVSRVYEVYCRNMTVNSLLQYYVGMARDEDIRCEISAECAELTIDPVDLTVIFGNAMENAIHACRKCPENRWISVQVGIVSGSLAIEISNSCKAVRLNRQFQTEDGFSPAEAFQSDRVGGGYGLHSLSYTARKYDGSARFRFNAETETFTTRIRLNAN